MKQLAIKMRESETTDAVDNNGQEEAANAEVSEDVNGKVSLADVSADEEVNTEEEEEEQPAVVIRKSKRLSQRSAASSSSKSPLKDVGESLRQRFSGKKYSQFQKQNYIYY